MIFVDKVESTYALLSSFGSVLVALSGGVDSSVLLKLASDCLPRCQVLAVTARSEISTPEELELAARVAVLCGITHEVVPVSDLEVSQFRANPPDRCYFCKLNRFSLLLQMAADRGLNTVVDGSNQSDLGDYRPGMRALNELGIRSPLLECGFTKDEIRQLAKEFGLPNWNQPSNACLASRFPYGTPITAEDLSRVARGENLLRSMGFKQCRLRHHGNTARIEINPGQFPHVLDSRQRLALVTAFKGLGYTYVVLDLEGFRSGSLNEVIGNNPDQLP